MSSEPSSEAFAYRCRKICPGEGLRSQCTPLGAAGQSLAVVRQGKRVMAHDLLAPIYGWFREGFATADLRDAKALLDELR